MDKQINTDPDDFVRDMSMNKVLIVFGTISIILLGIFVLILFSGDTEFQTDLWKEVAKIILQLVFIGLIGAYAAFLLNQYAVDRQKQFERREEEKESKDAEHNFRLEALNALTTSYWQIKKALHIISAHRSAKSYGEQMRLIIDYRLELQRLHNEIKAGMYKFKDKEKISKNLSEMDEQLKDLIDEWIVEYLRLSRLQEMDEDIAEPSEKKVPKEIDSLDVLNRIKEENFNALHEPFMGAANPIREQLYDLKNLQRK